MQHGDFTIGLEFLYGVRHWRCTDIGTRVVVAIRLVGSDRNAGRPGKPGRRAFKSK